LIKKPKSSAAKRKRKTKKSKIPKLYILSAAVVVLALISIITAAIYISQPTIKQINASSNQTAFLPPIVIPNATIDSNKTPPVTVPPASPKPKLVIIIDDVTFPSQIKKILSIPLHITPSFLPPKPETPFSEELAKKCKFYMVHLPLEAEQFEHPEAVTIWVNDSYDEIVKKLLQFKQKFPRAVYYNNHTGSKFTADLAAMRRLIDAMDELDLIFVDSRTTAKTKAPEIFAQQGRKLLQRDVFLDNEIEEGAIKAQLQLAIDKAKSRGYAVAIGHPHDKTLDTIAKSLEALRDVEVVYLKDL
jgi:polysaccharide deacetylase 2 family uncharacterized protein YibQ